MYWNVVKPSILLALVIAGASPAYAMNLSPLLKDRLYLTVAEGNTHRLIETDEIRKLYDLNGMAAFWTQNAKPNAAAVALKDVLKSADRYGLRVKNYWTDNLEALSTGMTEANAVTFELLLTDSYLRFAREISNGQVLDPDLIDEDIKMTKKTFDDFKTLVDISKQPERLREGLEALAPQHPAYKRLLTALARIKEIEKNSQWSELVDPGADILPGQSHATVPELKKRLHDLGYGLATNRTSFFDSEMQEVVKKYQELNRLPVIRNISRSLYASLGLSLQERRQRVEANLEKFRWFPRQWGSRYLFVNIAFQEMTVTENNQTVMKMKTVVGRPTRRTPTLKDEIRFVELNPTWTVPHSIATKDKLAQLQNNPNALSSQNIWIYDRQGNVINPQYVDWSQYGRSNFPFTLVQQPGSHNALGLVKFPLINPWFIYLHDTSEPHLMKASNRFHSSGCVRLERAFEFAQFLLKGQPEWTADRLKSQTQSQYRIHLKDRLPVYFLYQTVDIGENGELRTVFDDYGQDRRLHELFISRGSVEKF